MHPNEHGWTWNSSGHNRMSVKYLAVLLLLYLYQLSCPAVSAQGTSPRLLPPASDLRLTLRQDRHSNLSLSPSCAGEARLTLTCSAFRLTLKNASKRAIHVSGLACAEPDIIFERKEPRSSNGWWPVSQPTQLACNVLIWTNLRLKPGQSTQYATRLISPRRSADAFTSGSYSLRARWTIFGCTEEPNGRDCLAPLQIVREGSSVADVANQEPVTVVSNEVNANSQPLPDLGALRFAFEVAAHPGPTQLTKSSWTAAGCTGETKTSIECTVFHYTIRNIGDRPVRNATSSCGDSGITPEFSSAASDWKPVPRGFWICGRNFIFEREILPGGTVEGEFMLATLAPAYDTTPLRAAGEYRLRFTFWPQACIASPDASFCLLWPEKQSPVVSQEITLRAITGGPLDSR